MLPGLGGMNPKKMQGMMKQLGINQEEIEATKVTIETSAGNIEINNPSVQKITMQGTTSFQVAGDISESSSFSEDDINMVMEKTSCTKEQAIKTLEETGDIAEAILKLSE